MSKMRKALVAFGVLLMTVVGGVVFSASPAMAWSYCQNAPSVPGQLNLYKLQGYCGQLISITPKGTGSQVICQSLFDSLEDSPAVDFTGAAWNRTNRYVKFYPSVGCSGAPSVVLAPNTSHPNFAVFVNDYGVSAYHNSVALRWWS